MAISTPAAAGPVSGSDSDRVSASDALRSMVRSASSESALGPTGWSPTLDIVTNDGPFIKPGSGATTAIQYANSSDVLSTGVNGIGQMIAFEQASSTSAFLGLCTGTLINPRTVITAAHCVNENPAINYGSNTGAAGGLYGQIAGAFGGKTAGIPLSFGFSSTNRCLGATVNGCAVGTGPYERWRDSHFNTVTGSFIYNANQVWYGRASQPVELGGGGDFGGGGGDF